MSYFFILMQPKIDTKKSFIKLQKIGIIFYNYLNTNYKYEFILYEIQSTEPPPLTPVISK